MARMIVVSEKKLDALFSATLEKLKLEQFTGGRNSNMPATQAEIFYTDSMHRSFHYQVCCLKDALKNDD